jgi:hypothetical protein
MNDTLDQHRFKLDITFLIKAIVEGMDYNPGHSDLDDEQPVHVCIPLGEYRRAKRLWCELGGRS